MCWFKSRDDGYSDKGYDFGCFLHDWYSPHDQTKCQNSVANLITTKMQKFEVDFSEGVFDIPCDNTDFRIEIN